MSDLDLRAHIRDEVRRVETGLVVERRASGRGVFGMKRVVAQAYTDTPTTSRVLFATRPRVSGKGRWARLEALGRRLGFERSYALARDSIAEVLGRARELGEQLAARLAAIELPDGAFLLRRRYGCFCELAT